MANICHHKRRKYLPVIWTVISWSIWITLKISWHGWNQWTPYTTQTKRIHWINKRIKRTYVWRESSYNESDYVNWNHLPQINRELVSKETLQLHKTFSWNKTETQSQCYITRCWTAPLRLSLMHSISKLLLSYIRI